MSFSSTKGPCPLLWLICALLFLVGSVFPRTLDASGGESEADSAARLSALSTKALKKRRHNPSTILYPDQYIPLNFNHQIHVDDMGLDCDFCHDTAPDSTQSKDRLIPEEEVCLGCHEVGEEADEGEASGECSACHRSYTPQYPKGADKTDTSTALNPPPRMVVPTPFIKMNHEAHIAQGISCETCHREAANVELATRENSLPVMGTCLTCHDNKTASMECKTCHMTKPNGKVQTSYPTGTLVPSGRYFGAAHDINFYKDHASIASAREPYCLSCHEKKECVDCHAGNLRPGRVHPANWILIHPVRTRGNDPDCASCHRQQTFCVSCHEQARVVMSGTNAFDSGKMKFHPDGWVNALGSGRAGTHHAFEAQRNIRACASCHMEKDCVQCHASKSLYPASFGVNPHPIGFKDNCRSRRDLNPVVCKKCHVADQLDLLCR